MSCNLFNSSQPLDNSAKHQGLVSINKKKPSENYNSDLFFFLLTNSYGKSTWRFILFFRIYCNEIHKKKVLHLVCGKRCSESHYYERWYERWFSAVADLEGDGGSTWLMTLKLLALFWYVKRRKGTEWNVVAVLLAFKNSFVQHIKLGVLEVMSTEKN